MTKNSLSKRYMVETLQKIFPFAPSYNKYEKDFQKNPVGFEPTTLLALDQLCNKRVILKLLSF